MLHVRLQCKLWWFETIPASRVVRAANGADPIVGKPQVSNALRYLVDYEGMVGSFLAGQYKVHQAAWPGGLWGALEDTPFSLNVEKAKALLAEAGHGDGFSIRIDTLNASPFPEVAQSIQATLAKAGIKSEIVTAEGKTLWPMYRARKHQLILARYWAVHHHIGIQWRDEFSHWRDACRWCLFCWHQHVFRPAL